MNWSKTRQGSVNLAMLTVATMLGAGLRDAVGVYERTQDAPKSQVLRANKIELTAPGTGEVGLTLEATANGGLVALRGNPEESPPHAIFLTIDQLLLYREGFPQFRVDWSSGRPVGTLFEMRATGNEIVWQGPMMPRLEDKK